MNDVIDAHADPARQDNVNRILDTAERLFRHYGYTKTNVADIARELGMSPANVYRFFRSKADIHEALAERMLAASRDLLLGIAKMPVGAEERLYRFVKAQHQITVETMMDAEKVHEMVIVAIENQWSVVEKHLDTVSEILAGIIAEGVAAGELPTQDASLSAKCFMQATVALTHPQVVAQCPPRNNRATPDELIAFALRAIKG